MWGSGNGNAFARLIKKLASTVAGEGAALVKFETGATVQDLASTATGKGGALVGASIQLYGGIGDDSTDNSAALTSSASSVDMVNFYPGIYQVNTNTTVAAALNMQGGQIRIASGVTLTVDSIIGHESDIHFLGDGTLVVTDGNYSLGWYEGATADLKWDFLRRGLVAGDPYFLTIPRPRLSDPAATDYGTGNGVMWDFAAPMLFGDPENFVTILPKAGLAAAPPTGTIDSIIEFGNGAKTEIVTVIGYLRLFGRGKLNEAGLLITGCAHMNIPWVYGNDCPSVVKMKISTYSSNDIRFGHIYGTGILFDAQTTSGGRITELDIGFVDSDGSQTSGSECLVKLKGGIRRVNIDHVSMHAVVAGFYDCTDALVLIENETSAAPASGIRIGKVTNRSTTPAADGVRIKDNTSGAGAKISGVNIYDVDSPSTDAADLAYCVTTTVNNITAGTIRIGSDVSDTWVSGETNRSEIVDSGERTRLNGRITKILTIDDDTATSLSVPSDLSSGVTVQVGCDTSANTGMLYANTSATPVCNIIVAGANIVASTGLLSGTTGADTKFNINARGDGKMYFENRTGATLTVYVEMAG